MSETPAPLRRWYALDLVDRLFCAGLYVYFVYNIASDVIHTHRAASFVLLVSETTVLVFVLIRRQTADISKRPFDWGIALTGTLFPLLVLPGGTALISTPFVLGIMLCGAVLQIAAKLVLRRSFGIVAANRGVKVGGPYHFIRHPIYAGYIITQFGYLLGDLSVRNVLVYGIAWAAQIGRILAEERLLREDERYRAFAARTRYRLIPGLF